ncbi:hypothetical protein AVEN_163684-1 [Araneus ventricosus]|uniref:Uncharacterized protein n=1 Tax=Araneus ventricosus TaxID=182803 RepID=A0A4Y2LT87_ARAVE|nr:hypothetical protein AVEN_163684-1 [Araneus ventricosus]
MGVLCSLTFPMRDDFEVVDMFAGKRTWKYKSRKWGFKKRRKEEKKIEFGNEHWFFNDGYGLPGTQKNPLRLQDGHLVTRIMEPFTLILSVPEAVKEEVDRS